jgi:hypothetical protein
MMGGGGRGSHPPSPPNEKLENASCRVSLTLERASQCPIVAADVVRESIHSLILQSWNTESNTSCLELGGVIRTERQEA